MKFQHRTTRDFRALFATLPVQTQQQAKKAHKLLKQNPAHPSLHFKEVAGYRSARVSLNYRVLGLDDGETPGLIWWIWIGSHKDYDEIIKMGQ